MCKDLSQRTTDIQNAAMKSDLQKRCSRDSSKILQKVQRSDSVIFILYKDLLVLIIRFSNLYWKILVLVSSMTTWGIW